MKFKTKPVIKEAIQYTGTIGSAHEINKWSDGAVKMNADGNLTIRTLEGKLSVSPMDWVIKGLVGEFYPCKPQVFEATYDPA